MGTLSTPPTPQRRGYPIVKHNKHNGATAAGEFQPRMIAAHLDGNAEEVGADVLGAYRQDRLVHAILDHMQLASAVQEANLLQGSSIAWST